MVVVRKSRKVDEVKVSPHPLRSLFHFGHEEL